MTEISYLRIDANGVLWWTSEHYDLYFNTKLKIWVGIVSEGYFGMLK